MTTYKKYSIKNRKTRKIKLFKGGALEDDIKNAAIDKVKESVSNGKTGGIDDLIKKAAIDKVNTVTGTAPVPVPGTGNAAPVPGTGTAAPGTSSDVPVKSGKKVSILIDFYNKLLKSDDYGKKINNFNKFYEIININKNGMNMTESITGVEELFKIFKNEVEYIKATDAEKDAKKKNLSSNREKTKEINIEYKNGDYTITGEPVAPSAAAALQSQSGVNPDALQSQSGVKPDAPVTIDENIQETAKNSVFDAIITKIAVDGAMDKNSLVPDSKLEELYKKILKLTNNINENDNTIKNEENQIKINSTQLANFKKIENDNNSKIYNDKSKQAKLAILKAKNNTKITEIQKKISDSNKKIIETLAKNTVINVLLVPLNSEKEYYLKLLNRAYDILIKKYSSINEEKYTLVRSEGNNKKYIENMKMIRDKIKILESGVTSFEKLKNYLNTSSNKSTAPAPLTAPVTAPVTAPAPAPAPATTTPENAIINAAIKAVTDAV
jgi:hypothetical protein